MIKHQNNWYLLIFTLLLLWIGNISKAQISDPEYVFRGPVKTMRLTKLSADKTSKELITIFDYDKQGRKIKEVSADQTVTAFYYANDKTRIPDLQKTYHKKDGKEQSLSIEAHHATGKKLMSGVLDNGDWRYFYTYKYSPKETEEKMFSSNEIYHRKTQQSIDLSTFAIPKGFLPFDWDRNLSKAKDEKSIGYQTTNDYDHKLHFELLEKGNTQNKVEFYYNGSDVYDAGKGYWYRYKEGKKMEERYIYNAKDISDFGHRYTYNSQGKLINDTYGYFSKMPAVFMQRTLYQYNANGDLAKKTEEDADAKNPLPYLINYTYTYDNQNNWTSLKSSFKDGSGSIIKRTISYYQPGEIAIKNSLTASNYTAALQLLQQNKPIVEAQYSNYLQAKRNKERIPVPNINYESLRSTRWQDFLPQRQALDTLTTGDLNKDGLNDIVIVYQPEKLLKGQQNTERTLRILFRQPNGQYHLAAESKGAVADESMNNVFFSGIKISKGILIIHTEFLRGGCSHKYRYQNGGFYLIGADRINGDASYTSTIDYNLSTGKYVHEYTNENEVENKHRSVKKNGVMILNPLPNIKTFTLFSLEIEGVYL